MATKDPGRYLVNGDTGKPVPSFLSWTAMAGTRRTVSLQRHNLLLAVLWCHVIALAGLGLVTGDPFVYVGLATIALMAFAVSAMLVRRALAAAMCVSIGLVLSSIVLVSFSGGALVAHLHFFVMIAAVSLYRDRRPLMAATAVAVAYHLGLALAASFSWAEMTLVSGFLIALALTTSLSWSTATPGNAADERSLDQLRLAFEDAPIAMAMLKPSGEFLQVNHALNRLLDFEDGRLLGSNIRGVVHSDDMTDVGEAWEKIGSDDTRQTSLWVRCMTSRGTTIWVRMSLSLVPWTPEHSAMVVLQLEDTSQVYREQKRLERLVAGKDAFVAMVGDEAKEPLGLLVDLASKNPDLHDIEVRAREAISILDDLVTSARSGSGATKAMALPIDAETLCRDVVAQVPDSQDVSVDIGSTAICADPAFTRQILYGLVSNAIRFGGPNVVVKTSRSGPDTVIQVIDDGPEVPESERERIFRSDLRNGSPATRPATVGLTLTVGRHLARHMDGDITYRRMSDNRNVYELRLPSEELSDGYRPHRTGAEVGSQG